MFSVQFLHHYKTLMCCIWLSPLTHWSREEEILYSCWCIPGRFDTCGLCMLSEQILSKKDFSCIAKPVFFWVVSFVHFHMSICLPSVHLTNQLSAHPSIHSQFICESLSVVILRKATRV